MISFDVETDIKQHEIKQTGSYIILSSNFYKKYIPSKLETRCKTGMCFSCNFT